MEYLISPDEALFNGRVKLYPDGQGGQIVHEVMVCSRAIFNPHGLERVGGRKKSSRITKEAREVWEAEEAGAASLERWEAEEKANRGRAKRRARQRVYDLAACNRFDLFVTLTLDRQKCDRYDYKAVVRKLGQWLDNRVRRAGLRYLMVPEFHKDGAVHFHGLINSEAVKLLDSGRRYKDGRVIYNLPEWSLGFTTAIPLAGDYSAVCAYICKYITKQGEAVGGRYYLSGGKLEEPVLQYFNADFEAAEGEAFEIPAGGICFKVTNPADFF